MSKAISDQGLNDIAPSRSYGWDAHPKSWLRSFLSMEKTKWEQDWSKIMPTERTCFYLKSSGAFHKTSCTTLIQEGLLKHSFDSIQATARIASSCVTDCIEVCANVASSSFLTAGIVYHSHLQGF